MARYIKDIPISKSPQEIGILIDSFMTTEGFHRKGQSSSYGDDEMAGIIDPETITDEPHEDDSLREQVWEKGGIFLAPQFIRFVLSDGNTRLEAWLKFPLFPGLAVGEIGFSGLLGAPERALRNRVQRLEAALK
jgi:hypothetical protein